MSPTDIQFVVREVLRDVQRLSGRRWSDIEPTDQPIGHLDGFDSLASVEATVLLEEKLGCGDLGVDSVFISDDGSRALTMSQITNQVLNLLGKVGTKG
jgi:hypothetical protein